MIKLNTEPLVTSYSRLSAFIIISFFLYLSSISAHAIAQNNSKSEFKILSCDLVQYCSNPVSSNHTSVQPNDNSSQTALEKEVLGETNTSKPEILSNVSIIVTPHLQNETIT